jgi:hypothetical protein
LSEYKTALETTLKGFKPAKYLFVMWLIYVMWFY